jgi:hypothetical protein
MLSCTFTSLSNIKIMSKMRELLSIKFSNQISSTTFQNDILFQSANTTLYIVLGVIVLLAIIGFLGLVAPCLNFRKFETKSNYDF